MNIKKVEQDIISDIQELNFELEFVEFVNENNGNILRVVIDTLDNTPIRFEDCEIVTRKIEEKVDQYINKEYILEVSSPGLERKLKNIELYKKYIGEKIYIKLYKKNKEVDKKEIIGELLDVEDTVIKIKLENDYLLNIEYNDIASGNTLYDFNMKEG